VKAGRGEGVQGRPAVHGGTVSFALVSDEAGATDAGIGLVLGDGPRLRIRQGVGEATMRAVLAALESPRC
jgi:hypothetical protein